MYVSEARSRPASGRMYISTTAQTNIKFQMCNRPLRGKTIELRRESSQSIRVGSEKDRERYSYAADTILGSDGKGLRLLYRQGRITSPASNAEFNP